MELLQIKTHQKIYILKTFFTIFFYFMRYEIPITVLNFPLFCIRFLINKLVKYSPQMFF